MFVLEGWRHVRGGVGAHGPGHEPQQKRGHERSLNAAHLAVAEALREHAARTRPSEALRIESNADHHAEAEAEVEAAAEAEAEAVS